jgi:hypothetical protein
LLALGIGTIIGAGCGDDPPPRPIVSEGGGGGDGGGGGAGGNLPVTEGVISESTQSAYETDPQMDVNGSVVAVVWTARFAAGDPGRIGYVISTDGGASFSEPQVIASENGESYERPDVVVDNGGTVHVGFIGHKRIGGGAAIYVATAQGGATTLGEPEAITADDMQMDPRFFGPPRLTLTNTVRLVVAYTETVGTTYELRVATREQTGTEWTIQEMQQGNNVNHPTPCSAANTMMGNTYLAYQNGGRVTLLRSEDNGDTWNGTQASEDGDSLSGLPSCVAEGDNVWVSYGVRGNIGLEQIKVAYSSDGGETIQDVGVVSDPDADALFALHQLAVQAPETGHLVYYNGAGLGDKGGSLRRVQFSPANLEAPMEPPMPDDPPPGLPSVVVAEPITMALVSDDDKWLGRGIGLDYEASNLYVAYVDNQTDASHIAFKVVTF